MTLLGDTGQDTLKTSLFAAFGVHKPAVAGEHVRRRPEWERAKSEAGAGGELNPRCPRLLERFGEEMLGHPRRYSTSPHDDEGAYQRATEILLTHRTAGTDDELSRWLRTTTKHEALAINRHRARVPPAGESESVPEPPGGSPDAPAHTERFERLKLQEVRRLVLKDERYSC